MNKFKVDTAEIILPVEPFNADRWISLTRNLKLKYLSNHPEVIENLARTGMKSSDLAMHALAIECNYRQRHKIEMNLSMAQFPSRSTTLESFDFSVSQLHKDEILRIAECEWIANHSNCLFYGASGTGKTHLAMAIGKKAIVEKGYSVRFIEAKDLFKEMHDTSKINQLDDYLRLLNRCDLLIIDEFGYPTNECIADYAPLFYRLIHSRYEKKSILMTTNRQVRDWPRFLGNQPDCTMACVDRFMHHCRRVCFTGNSYRLQEMRAETLSTEAAKAALAKDVLTGEDN